MELNKDSGNEEREVRTATKPHMYVYTLTTVGKPMESRPLLRQVLGEGNCILTF
jgi:hypothetical protein